MGIGVQPCCCRRGPVAIYYNDNFNSGTFLVRACSLNGNNVKDISPAIGSWYFVLSDQYVYLPAISGTLNNIWRVPIGGGSFQLFATLVGAGQHFRLDVNRQDKKLIWGSGLNSSGTMGIIDELDGSDQTQLDAQSDSAYGVAFHRGTSEIYYVKQRSSLGVAELWKCNFDGTEKTLLNTYSFFEDPIDGTGPGINMTIDHIENRIWFTNLHALPGGSTAQFNSIGHVDLDGDDYQEVISPSGLLDHAFGDIDYVNKRLYYLRDTGAGRVITRTGYDGSNPVDIIQTPGPRMRLRWL